MLSVFETIDKILAATASVPTVAAQKAHLDLLREQLTILRATITKLEQENSELRTRLAEYEQRDNFIDIGICFLKKKPGGGVFEIPFCAVCKKPLSLFAAGRKYHCDKCAQFFSQSTVDSAIRKSIKDMEGS